MFINLMEDMQAKYIHCKKIVNITMPFVILFAENSE